MSSVCVGQTSSHPPWPLITTGCLAFCSSPVVTFFSDEYDQDAVEKLANLLGELDKAKEDHQKKIAALEKS